MSGNAGLKAGLIGAAILLVITLLNQIPVAFSGCVCCLAAWLAYVGVGALAGHFTPPPRTAGTGAGAGAIAGLISGAVRGLVFGIVMAIQTAVNGTADALSMLDPETLRQLNELGVDPETFSVLTGVGGVALAGVFCCMGALIAGAALGALGGALYSSFRSE